VQLRAGSPPRKLVEASRYATYATTRRAAPRTRQQQASTLCLRLSFFSRTAVDAFRVVKFERFRHIHPGATYERATRAYDRGRKRRGFALEFELAEVERNPADEVQRRLQRRFCLEKV
jgi:hypothetical protein